MKAVFLLFTVFSVACLAIVIPPINTLCPNYDVVPYLDTSVILSPHLETYFEHAQACVLILKLLLLLQINRNTWYLQYYYKTGDCRAIPLSNRCGRVSIELSLTRVVSENFVYEVSTATDPKANFDWFATLEPKSSRNPNGHCKLTYAFEGDMIMCSDVEILFVDPNLLIIVIHDRCDLTNPCQSVWILTSDINYERSVSATLTRANMDNVLNRLSLSKENFVKVDQSRCKYD